MRVLLVDDHAVVRSGLARILQAAGWQEVGEAADAARTLKLAAAESWDLVVIDAMLGQEDGLELAARLRRLYPRLPLMIFSMHSQPGLVRAAVKAGVQAFVAKDAQPEEVVAATLAARHRCFYLDSRVAPAFLRGEAGEERRVTILSCLQAGLSNREIAERTHLSVSSVKAELRALFQKHGVQDRLGLLKRLNLPL